MAGRKRAGSGTSIPGAPALAGSISSVPSRAAEASRKNGRVADTTNVQIDMSSVNGPGNVFHRRRESGIEWAPGAALATDRANVFVMDWRDHPAKDAVWYATRRAKAASDGLLHVFAQEVDRNYTAAVERVIIPGDWVASAIDAHLVLGFDDDGAWRAALDPADGLGEVPEDGTLISAHAREMVLPANLAVPLRQMLLSGGAANNNAPRAANDGGTTFHYHDHAGTRTSDEITANLDAFARTIKKAHRAGKLGFTLPTT